MEEKFWKKFSLGLIDRVIKILIPCPRRSRIAWFITSIVSSHVFPAKNLVPPESDIK